MNEDEHQTVSPPQVIRRDDGSFHVLNADPSALTLLQRIALGIDLWPQVKELMEANGEYKEPGRIGSKKTPGVGSHAEITERTAAAVNASPSSIRQIRQRAEKRPDVLERMRQDDFDSFNDVQRELGFVVISKLDEGRPSGATHSNSFFGHGDKFAEASEPLIRYLMPWRKKGFKYTHVNPKEAQRRLVRIDELIDGLLKTREDLAMRAHVATSAAPSERKRGER